MVASYISQGSHLYGRLFSVALSNNDGVASVWGNEAPGQSPIRVQFSIERADTGPGEAKVALWNLNPNSRNAIRSGTQIVLRAGYQGSMAQIFSGVVKQLKTARSGPDIVSQLECTDGLNFTNYAVIHQSYAAGTPLYRVFEDVAKAMLLDVDGRPTLKKNSVVAGIPRETLTRGRTIEGPVARVLNQLCKPRNLTWSIRNQRLVIRPRSHYDCKPVVVLSRDTGLIQVPAFNSSLVTFSALLIPGLLPGSVVQLQAQNQALSGNYIVTKYKADGDTHDSPWSIDCEGTRYLGTLNAIPLNQADNFATSVQ